MNAGESTALDLAGEGAMEAEGYKLLLLLLIIIIIINIIYFIIIIGLGALAEGGGVVAGITDSIGVALEGVALAEFAPAVALGAVGVGLYELGNLFFW